MRSDNIILKKPKELYNGNDYLVLHDGIWSVARFYNGLFWPDDCEEHFMFDELTAVFELPIGEIE